MAEPYPHRRASRTIPGVHLFDGYGPGDNDEAFDRTGPRPVYRELVDRLEAIGAAELANRARMVEAILRRQGITFTLSGDQPGQERTFPIDLVPRVITADDWGAIERGLVQRVTALNMFLDDVYVGRQEAIGDGIIPRWLVESSSGFVPEAMGVVVPHRARCTVAGIDLVRDRDGWKVLEDNLRVPSGISYVLENRLALTRSLPIAFARYPVRPVGHYGASLLAALQAVAPTGVSDPTIAVLTPGPFNSAYFEHVFLARQMGVELVEGSDLVVEGNYVHMRTTTGLQRVDVIYRRIGDEWLDPVAFRQESVIGVPGLMRAVRSGTVTVANAIGNGVADDKAIYPYVPDLIRYYLGEDPVLPNATTYLPWEPDQLSMILDRLGELVIKPVAEAGGYGIIIGP